MEEAKYESEFMQLVMGLQGSAWMLLGKIANPITGTQEKNIEGAKAVIETLLMLKEKTRGNLSRAEESLLNGALQQLQLNYVDEMNKGIEEKPEEAATEEKRGQKDSEEPRKTAEAKRQAKSGKKKTKSAVNTQ
jgi:hypothetical protein